MFYEPAKGDHGLPHNPFNSCVAPRPIGWISTLSRDGIVNLAPFSFFNAALSDPPFVVFSTSAPAEGNLLAKDTLVNAEETGEFVVNMVTYDLRQPMNETSAYVAPEVDEMEMAGLASLPSRLIKPPRVADSPIHMECTYYQTVELPNPRDERRAAMVIGSVVGIHIRDDVIVDGLVDMTRVQPLGKLGYMNYTTLGEVFSMPRPAPRENR